MGNWLVLLILLVVIVLSTVLHELAHGWVAYWLGDKTAKENGRLSLNPIKHIDPYMSIVIPVVLYLMGGPIFGGAKPVPVDRRNLKGGAWGMALVALAGPLTNLILAFLILLFAKIFGVVEITGGEIYYAVGNEFLADVIMSSVLAELGLCLFNILPVPPLDGSRILYALAPDGVRKVLDGLERYGMIFVFVLVMLGGSLLSRYMSGAMAGILRGFMAILGW